jgi:PAS domain S-box-containing protein
MEKRYFHKVGHLIWVHLNVSLVRDGQGNPLFFVSQIEDISERKKSEGLIKESEEKFRKLVEESLVGVFILQDDIFVYVNPQLEKITGYSKTDLLNEMSFEKLIEREDQQRPWKNYLSELGHGGPSGNYFLKVIRKTNEVLHTEVILSPITYEGKSAFIGTIIDITERVEEQKRINKAVTDAQERERQQISMELHDNVKQLMAGCLLNIDFMKMIVKDNKASAVIGNIKNYIREAIEEMRRISHQLAPSIDASISLEEKIKTVVNTMNVAKAIEIRYQFEELQEAIKADVQLAMYRIIQEQFTNILKHANASLVEIIVQRRNGDICMSIEDNGVGFDTHIIKNGIGLENIKRRVQVFNGSFSIQALAGKGCKLDVQFPVD